MASQVMPGRPGLPGAGTAYPVVDSNRPSGQAGCATHVMGSPQPRSSRSACLSASATSVLRYAAKVSTMSDHPAVGEHLGGLAERVHERLVQPPVRGHLADLGQEGRCHPGEPVPHGLHILVVLQRPVVLLVRDRAVPHVHLPDEARQQRADGLRAVLDGDLDAPVELGRGQPPGARDHLPYQPDVVLDHPGQQIHGSYLCPGGQPEAAWWMEVHPVGGVDLDPARRRPPLRRRHCVGPPECAGERLVRGIAGLHRDVEDVPVIGEQPVSGPLQQHPAAEPGRRLAADSPDDPVEVKPRDVHAGREVRSARTVIVEVRRQRVGEAQEQVLRRHRQPGLRAAAHA
jgi:hypothetical protein